MNILIAEGCFYVLANVICRVNFLNIKRKPSASCAQDNGLKRVFFFFCIFFKGQIALYSTCVPNKRYYLTWLVSGLAVCSLCETVQL